MVSLDMLSQSTLLTTPYAIPDLSSLYVTMLREVQIATAISLRTAVWNWIERFPAEFNDAIRTRGRMEGAPERMFDLLYTMSGQGNERIVWPCLAMLSCITYDRISSDFQTTTYGNPNSKRKVSFFKGHIVFSS